MTRPVIDLTADIHGRAIDYARTLDRRYFAKHPHATTYERPPIAHELCDPQWAARGKCVPLFDLPDGWHHVIEVRQVMPGVRVRAAWRVRDAKDAA